MLKATQAQESVEALSRKVMEVADALQSMKLASAAEVLCEGIVESVTYYRFSMKNHRIMRTNNMVVRMMEEIRRRTRVVGCFPDGKSALMLACTRLRYVASKLWLDSRGYLEMKLPAVESTCVFFLAECSG